MTLFEDGLTHLITKSKIRYLFQSLVGLINDYHNRIEAQGKEMGYWTLLACPGTQPGPCQTCSGKQDTPFRFILPELGNFPVRYTYII
jgi:hypothetical protein